MKKSKMRRMSRPIVIRHLEKVSSRVFEEYSKQVTELVEKGQGVYALYKGQRLYYIGLASDLDRRVKWHLRDKHKGQWDRFSLYMIRKTDHIREVEALLVRIADPKGNRVKGKLGRSKNMLRELQKAIKYKQGEDLKRIFGRKRKKRSKAKGTKKGKALAGLFRHYQPIYARYKGREYKANVCKSGIKFNGKIYNSPSGAAKAIIDRGAVNGWGFWKYKDKNGELRPIKELR